MEEAAHRVSQNLHFSRTKGHLFFRIKKKNLRRIFKNTVSQLEIGSRKNYLTQRVFKLKNLSLNARKNTDRMAFKTFPTPFEQVIVGCSLIRRILLFFFCFFF